MTFFLYRIYSPYLPRYVVLIATSRAFSAKVRQKSLRMHYVGVHDKPPFLKNPKQNKT